MATLITGSGVDKVIDGSITSTKIADGTITNADINASAGIAGSKVDGSFGKVLQVVTAEFTGTNSTSSTGWQDISNLSVSITPVSSSSNILVLSVVQMGVSDGGAYGGHIRLLRGSTQIAMGDADGNKTQATGAAYSDTYNYQMFQINSVYLDSPTTTSATIYKAQFRSGWASGSGAIVYINRAGQDGNYPYSARYNSTITLMEIGA